jgi:hypothetical protein
MFFETLNFLAALTSAVLCIRQARRKHAFWRLSLIAGGVTGYLAIVFALALAGQIPVFFMTSVYLRPALTALLLLPGLREWTRS